MNLFTINEKEYRAKEFDFNLVCDLEDMGISLEQAERKPMSMARAYFALCAGKGRIFAGKEIETHLVGGGSLDGLMDAMSDEMERSDFFRSLKERKTEEAPENPTEEAIEQK